LGKDDEEFNLSEEVVTIGASAFSGSKNLKYINLINGHITTIKTTAFAYCEALETIIIPDTVTAMGDNVFFNSNGNLQIFCQHEEPSDSWNSNWNSSEHSVYYYSEQEPTNTTHQYWHYNENNEPTPWPVPVEMWNMSVDDNESEVYASIYKL
jgi:hypothetical protein